MKKIHSNLFDSTRYYQANRFKRMKFLLYQRRQWGFHQIVRKIIGMKQSRRQRAKIKKKRIWKEAKGKGTQGKRKSK